MGKHSVLALTPFWETGWPVLLLQCRRVHRRKWNTSKTKTKTKTKGWKSPFRPPGPKYGRLRVFFTASRLAGQAAVPPLPFSAAWYGVLRMCLGHSEWKPSKLGKVGAIIAIQAV